MVDAKDILGLPKSAPPLPHEKRPRPPKEPNRKPEKINREVFALTGKLAPPVVPAVEPLHLKRRPINAEKEKITWQWLPFTSSARSDNLQLYHWVRVVNGVAPKDDYPFAKYNKSVNILRYTDEEYERHLIDPTWTKQETDHLFDLCDRFDLRFIVIADRFPTSRTVEELKSRYYSVSRKLLLVRAPSHESVAGHPLVKENFNAAHETERKRALSLVLTQTKQQESKDNEILEEAKRIMESRMASKSPHDEAADFEKTSPDAVSPSNIHPSSSVAPTIIPENKATLASLRMLRVYLRTHAFDQMVQSVSATAGPRTIKRVDQTLQDLGVHLKPKVPTEAVCAEHLELRREIITLLSLQKQLQNKEAEAAANRDSSLTDAPGTPKRAGRDVDRLFLPDSLTFGGDRVGKKDQKRKGSGRFVDAPPSPPQSKRPRKLKITD